MCVCVWGGGGGSNYFALYSTELLTAVAFIRSSTKSTIAVTHSSTNRNALRENEQSFYQRHNKNGFYSTAVEVFNIHSPLYFSPSSLDSALKLLYTAYRVDPTKEPMLWRSGVISHPTPATKFSFCRVFRKTSIAVTHPGTNCNA